MRQMRSANRLFVTRPWGGRVLGVVSLAMLLALPTPGQAQPAQADSSTGPAIPESVTGREGYVDFLGTPEAVNRAVERIFNKRYPPEVAGPIGDAWKGIVADASQGPVKIICDTDIGTDVDDAIALSFALGRPELEVLGITTSRRKVDERAAIVSRLLQVLGRTDIPFAPGSLIMANGEPFRGSKPVNQFPFAGPDDDRPSPTYDDAQELFRQVVEENPGEVWLVVMGPMTNAAILVRDHPEVAKSLKGIVCMGGDLVRASAETNITNDPWAADIVFRSGLLRFVATDEVSIRLLVTRQDIDRLKAAGTPKADALLELISLWKSYHFNKPGPVGFDVCPIAGLFAPELFTTESMGVKVEMEPRNRRGITVPSPDAPACAVTTDMNAVAVHRLLMDTLTAR